MNNREVAHLWAAQSRTGAKGSNFYFEGRTIYSYGPHFPVATIHERNGRRAVLFTDRTYSVTTSKHQGYAANAVRHLPCFRVPHISPVVGRDHSENFNALAQRVADCATKAMRRTTEQRVEWDAEEAARAHKALADYVTFFGVRRKMIPMPGFAAAFERARRIENPDPASLDKRERAKAARKAAKEVKERKARELQAVHDMARRTDWRLFGEFTGYVHNSGRVSDTGPVMLRVNGDAIETSMGARVPLAAAPMVWQAVSLARRRGREFSRGRGLARIGDYPLDRIDADGTLHAGCHTIPYSELASMARALGLS